MKMRPPLGLWSFLELGRHHGDLDVPRDDGNYAIRCSMCDPERREGQYSVWPSSYLGDGLCDWGRELDTRTAAQR